MRACIGLIAVLLFGSSGCAGDNEAERPLTVFAAASLTEVFTALETDARFNFAGSDDLATQIREGASADVYAAASPRFPQALEAEGLVGSPRIFATNTLVVIVPADNPASIESVSDVGKAGVKLVIGAEGVPIGDYTRTVLENLGATPVLENVVSNEDDVKGVVGKVVSGEADAGFVYVTDARAAGDEVQSVDLPAEAQAVVEYPISVVSGSDRTEEAERFIELVLGPDGRRALERAGFGLP